MKIVAALLIGSVSAFAQAQDFGRNLAREAFDNFQQIKWGSVGRAAAGPGYIAGPSAPGWNDADGLACFRYRSEYCEWERNADYYAFDPAAPACRLLRVRITTAELKPEIVTVIYDSLRDALDRQYGAGRDLQSYRDLAIVESGSAGWAYLRQWNSNGIRILLFVRTPKLGGREPRVEILAEHHDVSQARGREASIRSGTIRVPTGLPEQVYREVVAEVGDVLPKLGQMLGEPSAPQFDEGTLRATLQILMNLSGQAKGERRAVLLLAADRVAERLALKLEPGAGGSSGELGTRVAGVQFHLGIQGGWMYRHGVLDRLWREHADTRWGEAAFVLRQDWTEYCGAKPAHFDDVIENSEGFLREHAGSPYRMEALFQLAQAYEDWWNAGHPVDGHFAVTPAKYASREDEMRRKAIAAYEQILAAEPDSPRGQWAALRLPRLKLKLRTNWYRFVDSCS